MHPRCNICHISFSKNQSLHRHMREVHGEVWYNCNYCTKAYKRQNDLTRHQERHHTRVLDSMGDFNNNAVQVDPFHNNNTSHTIASPNPAMTRSTQSQTDRSKIPRIPKQKIHAHTNTPIIKKVDKCTNTEPMIILTPTEVDKLQCGAHIFTYKNDFSIFMSTNNSSITPITNPTNQPTTSTPTTKVITPNQNNTVDMDDTYNHCQKIKRTGKAIKKILNDSIQETKIRTTTSLAKNSLRIKKDNPKVKKAVNKLTNKYCPMAKEIARTPKSYEHISSTNKPTDKPTSSLSVQHDTTDKSHITNSFTNNTDNNLTLPHVTLPKRKKGSVNSSKCSSRTSTSFTFHNKDNNYTTQNHGSDTSTVIIDEPPCTSSAIVSALPDGQTQIHLPDNTGTLSPTALLEGSINTASTSKSVTDWERLIMEEYNPEEPSITYISSDEESTDGDHIDPDFRAKLDELFGPISP